MNQAVLEPTLDDNHSHSQIVRRIPRYARVLELGCGDGSMSRLLQQRCEASIIGIERNPQAAWRAQWYCDYVFNEDLDDPHSLDALEGEKFDIVTLVDVLEHLQHPAALLERLKPLLLDEGLVLLSVPNVAHASVRLELLGGNFRYESAGILDATHLRFFTAASLQGFLQEAGYTVLDMDYTWHDMPDNVIAEYLQAAGLQATPEALAAFHTPEAVAYQFIVSARPQSSGVRNKLPGAGLKPMDASWQSWGKLHGELAQTREALQDARAELDRVYATRSWKMLRTGASALRNIQSRFTHH
jgi:2-polyprenyl-3-methyl-5-hydroxy-6-metoxy-1,4-benzoquinol methylase